MGRFEIVVGRFEIFVGRCGSLWVFLRSLWIVVGRCGSFRLLVLTFGSSVTLEAHTEPDVRRTSSCWGSNNFLGLLNILLIFINK